MISSISFRATQFIENQEVGDNYIPHAIWPGGQSGITLAIGYDLSAVTATEFLNDWSKYLTPAQLTLLTPCCGHSGATAMGMLSKVSGIPIPYTTAKEVFETINLPRALQQTTATFPNCGLLSPDSLGALVSLVYNRGPSLDGPRRVEMRQIRDAMVDKRFADIPQLIRNMRWLWLNSGMGGLIARRNAEATLFQQGLVAV